MSDRDYYEILGLTPRADGMMVDQAYWHLARKYQALAQTNASAHAMLDELNEAYGVLGTPRLRKQYDAFRDDVLIRKGMIQPVSSKQKREKKRKNQVAARDDSREGLQATHRASVTLPAIRLPNVRIPRQHRAWYAGTALCLAFLGGAAWLGVNPLIAVGIACAAVALAATRALRPQLPAITLTMPQISAPELRTPRIDVPKPRLPDLPRISQASAQADEPVAAGALRDSTAAMISRWRNSIGLRPVTEATAETQPTTTGVPGDPSTTLIDIVSTERRLNDDGEEESDPLAAVIDILRGTSTRIPETEKQ